MNAFTTRRAMVRQTGGVQIIRSHRQRSLGTHIHANGAAYALGVVDLQRQ
jgi:hypothetical protein